MLSVSVGPFIFTPFMLAFTAAFITALFAGWLVSRGKDTTVEPTLSVMLLVGLAVARLAFVAQYLGDYASAPWRIFDLRDGGFIGEAGIAAALVTGAYSAFKEPLLRPALGAAIASGVLVAGIGGVLFKTLGSVPTGITALPLNTLEGEPFSYSSTGKPVVANLWATWCPPCRREMPVLAEAQQREKDIEFIFVNQGELAESVRVYLEQQTFSLSQVYLDEQGQWASQMGAAGMPTTLFFDKSGNLIGSHTGELSKESLNHALKRYFR